MEIINPGSSGDFHIHSSTFSDGFNSIDEIVIATGKLGYQKIAITDHCQALLDAYGMTRKTHYDIIDSGRWSNIHNDMEVIFGIEADLLNEKGDICDHIQGFKSKFIILSAHKKVFSADPKQIKISYLNAIDRFEEEINLLGHLCSKQFAEYLNKDDLIEIIDLANQKGICFELNCANLVYDKTEIINLNILLKYARQIYVNSDAHTLNELLNLRKKGFQYLENWDKK